MIRNLLNKMKDHQIPYLTNQTLSDYCTLHIGGICPAVIIPETVSQLETVLSETLKWNIPFEIIGKGSNVFFHDDGNEFVLILTDRLYHITSLPDRITAECGVSMPAFCRMLILEGYTGMEGLSGIPGTIGGGIVMNAGAFGNTVSDYLISVSVFDIRTLTRYQLKKSELEFGNRYSVFQNRKNLILISADFCFPKGNPEQGLAVMKENAKKRAQTQPLSEHSAGSYFKRPENGYAGQMIEACGLKGFAVGGAVVSEKHAGFLLNRNHASAKNLLELEKHVTETVENRFGIRLQREVILSEGRQPDELCR